MCLEDMSHLGRAISTPPLLAGHVTQSGLYHPPVSWEQKNSLLKSVVSKNTTTHLLADVDQHVSKVADLQAFWYLTFQVV